MSIIAIKRIIRVFAMKTFETNVIVGGNKMLNIPMPAGLVHGEHAVLVIIDERMITANSLALRDFPVDHIGACRQKNMTFRREEIYGDEGR